VRRDTVDRRMGAKSSGWKTTGNCWARWPNCGPKVRSVERTRAEALHNKIIWS